jgi:dynein assembly factor 1
MAEDLREQYTMTLRRLKEICAEREGYQRPELNETLELQYKGFGKIENLHHYYNIHALFLEQNSIVFIEGLDELHKLKCLYLAKNRICKIDNISHLSNLCHLDLSHNPIEKIEGLKGLTNLKIFKATHCRIEQLENCEGLRECQSIESLDIKHNQIQATDEVPAFFGRVLPDLQCLYYTGNPGARTIKQYRKRCIGALKKLKYLDERPIFEDERATSEAFCTGGSEAEKLKRAEIHERNARKEEDEREEDLAWRERTRKQHEAGELPYVLPQANWDWDNTNSGTLTDLWKQINDDSSQVSSDTQFSGQLNEGADQWVPSHVDSEAVTGTQTPQDTDPNYAFDPPARVEDVLQNERSDGSWQILSGTSQGPPSELMNKTLDFQS